ncbi:ribosomal protein S14 [Rhodoblastus acidophilus]|uniref:hypothetical protein n=1 Tax=Rhodoblastus acidophilus TaxID=1074 RepID=UPI0022256E17|nr:hypothetical protein [Rhodoblastus acidophilus]MCW2282588.1 ribosomal protein S14 [Rhodoblastus acidophilus]MCW2331449.1 ribosomal protein S14 [Rhodoblastus acidophilus]
MGKSLHMTRYGVSRAEDLPDEIGIAVTDTEGGTLKSFVGTTGPMPDESLIGWLARTAAFNAHRSLVKTLWSKVGVRAPSPAAISQSLRGEAARVAFLLRADPNEVLARACPEIVGAGSAARIDFFGVPIRPHYRNLGVRRVSPLALRQSGYHRAVWELRPLAFDPGTMERLLQNCPVCGSVLGWRRTFGICHCDRCKDRHRRPTVDLRAFPQPLVEVEDMEALAFVASLVDPLRSEPTVWGSRLSSEVRELSRGEMFDLSVALAAVLENDSLPPGERRALRFSKAVGALGLEPRFLALAGRALLDWPRGFFRVADALREGMDERGGAFGLNKELGSLLRAKRAARFGGRVDALLDRGIAADVARTDMDELLLRREEYRSANRINVREAVREFGIDQDRLVRLADSGALKCVRHRRIIVFDRAELEEVILQRADAVGAMRTAALIGVPLGALPDLTAHGLVEKIKGPVVGMLKEKEQYRLSALDALLAKLRDRAHEHARVGDERLTLSASHLFVGPKPWAGIVEAVLSGMLPVRSLNNRLEGVLDRMAVDPDEFGVLSARFGTPVAADLDGMTNYVEAAAFFGVSRACFSELTSAGLLPARDRVNLRIRRGDLADFADKFLFTGEAVRRLRLTKAEGIAFLRAQGVEPVAIMLKGKMQLWAKADVQVFFVA